MKKHGVLERSPYIAGCLAVLAMTAVSAQAQDTTQVRRNQSSDASSNRARVTSQVRIPVQKEMGGEVMSPGEREAARQDSMARAAERMRLDSIAAAESARRDSIAAVERQRQDSIETVARIRRDSIEMAERMRLDSIARVDSIARAYELERQRIRDRYLFDGTGWYVGLSGGSAIPSGEFESIGYDNGYTVNVPIGWHSRTNFLGLRLDLGYSQFQGNAFVGGPVGGSPLVLSNNDPKVLSATMNVTARIPLNGKRTWHLYGVGGGGVYHFRNIGNGSALNAFLGDESAFANTNSTETRNEFGGQLGGGIDFGVGPASLFVESRLVNVFSRRDDSAAFSNAFGPDRGTNLRWVPIVLGVTFR